MGNRELVIGHWLMLNRLWVVLCCRRYQVVFFVFVTFWSVVAVRLKDRYSVVAFF